MLRFHISNKWERQQLDHFSGPLEFGRGPKRPNAKRYVIRDDLCVSRDHVKVDEVPTGRARVENLSGRNPILLIGSNAIAPGAAQELDLPVRLAVGETVIEITHVPDVDPKFLKTIDKPVHRRPTAETAGQSIISLGSTPSPETLMRWFETVIAVQKAAAGSPEFYDQTARALVELVGLDRGLVLLRRGDDWEVAARYNKETASGQEFSLTILQHALDQRQTFFLSAAALGSTTESLQGIEAVVASPVVDARDQVIAAVYGSRMRSLGSRGHGISPLEAQVVQLLASAVANGLARVEQEAEAAKVKVQFEQFFSPQLAQALHTNPRMLEGQDRDVTVLFSDIRGFSRITQKLGASDTCRLVGDVMEKITGRVMEFGGVVVDFAGDGMLAMWNAPMDQPDHAVLACKAALAMMSDLPGLSAGWRDVIGNDLGLGIGINTGPALCGNVGSKFRFKYGPFGHTVNLASRVEGGTKQLGIPILITESTRNLVGDAFATRRLCRVRVVGMAGAVDLYELHAEVAAPEWLALRDSYEAALKLYESEKWADACREVNKILANQMGDYDIPSLDLIARSVECIKHKPDPFDPVMDFRTK